GSPRSEPSRSSGWTTSILLPWCEASFCVATTSPTTRAISMGGVYFSRDAGARRTELEGPRRGRGRRDVDRVHYGNDRGFGGNRGGKKGKASFATAAPVDDFAGAGTHGIQCYKRAARVASFGTDRLKKQQLVTGERRILHGADDVADDASEAHESLF